MNEHIQSPMPKGHSPLLEQYRNALASARAHLDWLEGHCKGNTLAIKTQHRIIGQWKARIAELAGDVWPN